VSAGSLPVPSNAAMADFRDELVAMEQLLERPADLQTCHRDLWADNLRRTPTGRLCVIDWQDCGLAEPSQELGLVLYEFGTGNSERARSLYEAYVDSGGPGRVDRRGNFSMVIAQLGHINESGCREWLDPAASSRDRDRSAARFAEFTSRPLTCAVIDALLDAVAG
jgi:hypothetical protein